MSKGNLFFSKKEKSLAILIDPDKFSEKHTSYLKELADKFSPSYFLVGGSFMSQGDLEWTVLTLKEHFHLPVILFPGDFTQITGKADALLFLTLLSGRNPEYLAGQQVKAAPFLKKAKINVIPVAYLLIDGGKLTTVQYITQTLPLPNDKKDLILATALAGQYMGMQAVYLEAGSGALQPVSTGMVKFISENTNVPLIVGGGIKPDQIKTYFNAGANVVVIGTEFEKILK